MARSIRRFSVVLGVLLASTTAAVTASASETYPLVIAQVLSIDAPKCVLCHTQETGGAGTVTTVFGVTAMSKYGLVRLNPELLKTVLAKMEADGVDSDGDGIGDIAELRAGGNPNDGPVGSGEPPRYGIYCNMGHAGSTPGASAWCFAGAAAVWLGRRRSQSRRVAERRVVG